MTGCPILALPIPWREALGVYFHKRVRGVDAAIHSRPSNLVGGTSQLLPVGDIARGRR